MRRQIVVERRGDLAPLRIQLAQDLGALYREGLDGFLAASQNQRGSVTGKLPPADVIEGRHVPPHVGIAEEKRLVGKQVEDIADAGTICAGQVPNETGRQRAQPVGSAGRRSGPPQHHGHLAPSPLSQYGIRAVRNEPKVVAHSDARPNRIRVIFHDARRIVLDRKLKRGLARPFQAGPPDYIGGGIGAGHVFQRRFKDCVQR